MKITTEWLKQWVSYPLSDDALAELLTTAGLEIEERTTLADTALWTFKITPNRGDCLSIMGLAREVSALVRVPLQQPLAGLGALGPISQNLAAIDEDCRSYHALYVDNLAEDVMTPDWIRQRLEAVGFQSSHFLVDVTNYVMLELGQPLHAFDANKLQGPLNVRKARASENLELLNGQMCHLSTDTLVVADTVGPVALAGVMGGARTAISSKTRAVILESAHFNALQVRYSSRYHKCASEAAYRFARHVDPQLTELALKRAWALIQASHPAARIKWYSAQTRAIEQAPIVLRHARLTKLLGFAIARETIQTYLEALQMQVEAHPTGFQVQPPSFRADLKDEIDLIEEVMRLYGLDKVPEHAIADIIPISAQNGHSDRQKKLKSAAQGLGYHEVINYSFADPQFVSLFYPESQFVTIANPLSSELKILRPSLIPGLAQTARYNHQRQQDQIRLFELGQCFSDDTGPTQSWHFAGLCFGHLWPEHWHGAKQGLDFFDLKAHVGHLLAQVIDPKMLTWERTTSQCLHPGQSAQVHYQDALIARLGQLHPKLAQLFDFDELVWVFEIDLDHLPQTQGRAFREISKFPSTRRDLALLVNQDITAQTLEALIRKAAGPWLSRVVIFDFYTDHKLPPNTISVGLGLIWQHPSQTLAEADIQAELAHILKILEKEHQVSLRQ